MPYSHYLAEELEQLIKNDVTIWRFITKSFLDGVWYWDLENPENEWMSPEFWTTLGVDPSTKAHKAAEWQDLIFPEDGEKALENFHKHLADPSHPYDQIVRYKHANGGTVWVRCRGMAIRNAEGRPTRLLGAHTDVTQLQRLGAMERELAVEAKLAEVNQRNQLVLDTVANGVIGLSAEKDVVTINPAGRHMLSGVSQNPPFAWPSQIRFLDSFSLQPLEPQSDPLDRALSGEHLVGETHVLARDCDETQPRYVRVSSTTIDDAKTKLRTVIVLEDTSDAERRRQQAERSSRLDALGQLTGGIAHDFNNILSTIQYSCQLALMEAVDDKAKALIETAVRSVERGADLASRMLAFAKHQPGRASSRAVQKTFDEVLGLMRPAIEEQIQLSTTYHQPELIAFCDQGQLENAIINLIINSRDAIMRESKGDKITIEARGVSDLELKLGAREDGTQTYPAPALEQESLDDIVRDDGRSFRYVEIAVTDNGAGMTEAVKRRAVDPFFTTKSTNSGSGLGLSMVYGFVQQAGGELRIYSERGHGTTVRMLLPRGELADIREQPVIRAPDPVGRGETILVVEDEPALLEMLSALLEKIGYKVVGAMSGAAAMTLLEQRVDIDLLLTDVVMPGGVNGFELAQKARQLRPDLPVLYMSGYTGFTDREMGEVVAPLLAKPCSPVELGRRLMTTLAAASSGVSDKR